MTSMMSMRSITSVTRLFLPWLSVTEWHFPNKLINVQPQINRGLRNHWSHLLVSDRSYFKKIGKTLRLTNIGVIKYKEMLNRLVKSATWMQLKRYSRKEQKLQVPENLLVHTGQVFSELKHLTTTSTGPDRIPNKIRKIFAFEFVSVITDILDTSMKQGTFPDQLKRSLVVPMPSATSLIHRGRFTTNIFNSSSMESKGRFCTEISYIWGGL